MYKQNYK